MSITTFNELRTLSEGVGITTLADLLRFNEREHQEGERLLDTVHRYYAEVFDNVMKCAERLGVDTCENCVYCNCCDEYNTLLNI